MDMNSGIEKIKVNTPAFVNQLQSTLEEKGYATEVLNSDKEVKDFINANIPDKCVVGLGDSVTNCKLNVRNILLAKGSKVFYSWNGAESYNRSIDTFESPIRPDYYLTRINAITTFGDILLKDYSKKAFHSNMLPKHIFAFAGNNRIVEGLNNTESIHKYPVITKCPAHCKFTVALLPFLDY